MPSKTILEMSGEEAKKYFLKANSYFSTQLPEYFELSNMIREAQKMLGNSKLEDISYSLKTIQEERSKNPNFDGELLKDCVDANIKIMSNKDAKYSWRPLTLIHPIIYVDLVNQITLEKNWDGIVKRFKEFQKDDRVICTSIPIESTVQKSDQTVQILSWWKNLEQAQIKMSLDFEYCIQSDITDCYPSIYTHTISWALHGKEWAKVHRHSKDGIGNMIDTKIQSLQGGQTNGIPQGSVLMDFIAEMVLGYADLQLLELVEKAKIEKEFKILRYRDDYRIFSNHLDVAEKIMKLLSEVLLDLNLKINSKKTFLCTDIIIDGIKPDKLYWTVQSSNLIERETIVTKEIIRELDNIIAEKTYTERKFYYKLTLQKHLLQIKILGDKFPNCGQLLVALKDFYKNRVMKLNVDENQLDDIPQLISIVTSIMIKNPRTIQICVAILHKLLSFLDDIDEIEKIIDLIISKCSSLPNADFVEIWLQNISVINNRDKKFRSPICQKVVNPEKLIWNSQWLSLEKRLDESMLINETKMSELSMNYNFNIDDFDDYIFCRE
ncbi:hypothetical protein FKX92_08520 [Streptococcus sanguinis]|jgi:hypothetical protein|uniref:Reverse transcriptase domain-containing protein n=1 Tax=Streptococcus sanguinis TaxID=1305 RepID=A0A5A7ZL12_STRSA|nr:RNA-directed DNA polymerase [Streptococcus sanguinis]KAA0116607.1 hypothetical protein FKX92_08520 [Streptococcus sanguinis]